MLSITLVFLGPVASDEGHHLVPAPTLIWTPRTAGERGRGRG